MEEVADCVLWGRSVQAEMEGKKLAQSVNRFAQTLPKTQRRLFVLRYRNLYPIREIAERYNFSESKVKSQLSRTRKELR